MERKITAAEAMELRALTAEVAHTSAICAGKELAMLTEHPEWANLVQERKILETRRKALNNFQNHLKEVYALSDGDTIDTNTGNIECKSKIENMDLYLRKLAGIS